MTSAYLPLDAGEIEIPITQELLWRQITHALWVSESGTPSSHAFGPATADQGKPSYSRQSIVKATEAMAWHNANARSPSLAVWAVAVIEVDQSGTRSVDDHALRHSSAPGHCYVDYRHMDKSAQRSVRARLLIHALRRGAVLEALGLCAKEEPPASSG